LGLTVVLVELFGRVVVVVLFGRVVVFVTFVEVLPVLLVPTAELLIEELEVLTLVLLSVLVVLELLVEVILLPRSTNFEEFTLIPLLLATSVLR